MQLHYKGGFMKFSLRRMIHCLIIAIRADLYYRKNNGEITEIQSQICYLRSNIRHYKNGEEVRFVFNSGFVDKYFKYNTEIFLENKCNLYYVMHNGKKMYMKRSFTKDEISNYYKSIIIEQDSNSPHCYFPEKVNMYDKTLVDCGVAEGNFCLDYVEDIKEAFLFEPDEEWLEALQYTYEPWRDKIHIIPKFVGSKDNTEDNKHICLDSYFEHKNIKIDYLKMDIEGAEVAAIKGAKKCLQRNNKVTLLICAYHNKEDEMKLKELLYDYAAIPRKGKILMIWDQKVQEPYFRTGVIEFQKSKQKQ